MNMISPIRSRLVLVGNGMAGVRALEEILSRAPHHFAITVFGAEPHGNYNRIMLSPVLAGEKTFESITTHPKSWYEENGIELIAGEQVVGIDRGANTVTGARGTVRHYDVLLLATGSNPVIIPLPGHHLPEPRVGGAGRQLRPAARHGDEPLGAAGARRALPPGPRPSRLASCASTAGRE